MTKLLEGNLTISRPTYGSGEEFITIEITDELSRTRFLSIRVSYSDFTKCITGQSFIPVEFEARNLDQVGLKREDKPLVFPVKDFVGGADQAAKICQAYTDDGWTASTYFRSQNSIRKIPGTDKNYEAHGTQYRYVKPEEVKE